MKPEDKLSKWGSGMAKNLTGMKVEKKLRKKTKLEKEIERRMKKY